MTLIFLFILGSALRLYQLSFQCYWTEEVYSALMSLKNPAEIYFTVVASEFNPPGFYFLEYITRVLLGYSEWALRVPSLICGILLIPSAYYLGKEYKDEIAGLALVCFVVSSYTLFYYSQFARGYSLSLLLFFVALLYYLKLIKGDTRWGNYLLLGVVTGLSCWAHFFSLIPLSLLWVILFIKIRPDHQSRVIVSSIVAAAISLPLLPMIFTFINGRVYSEAMPYGLDAKTLLLMIPTEFFSSAFMVFGILVVMGAYVERRGPHLNQLLLIGVITIIVGLLVSSVTMMYARYFLYVLPILYLASASFISEILKGKSERVVVVVLLVFTLLLLAVQAPDFIAHYTVQQYNCSILP